MKRLALVALAAMLGWGLYLNELRLEKRREYDVRMWAEAAFEEGFTDGFWKNMDPEVIAANKKTSVDAVIAAHKGAWDNAPQP